MSFAFPCDKILVPVNFTDESRRALSYAVTIARVTGASLVLVSVVEDTFPYPELFAWDHPDEDYYRYVRTRSTDRMRELLDEHPAVGEVQQVVVRGRPAAEIIAVAEQVGADLVVMARQGVSGLRAAIMGSTTESVVRGASCPVLVLPPSADEPAPEPEKG